MQIQERDLRKWFPKDKRFLYFCAKYYKLSFYDDETVEEAQFIAAKNVMSLYNRGVEFDNEAHMVGTVMSSFRFAILNAYKTMESRRKLKSRPMTDYEFTGDDDFNPVMNRMVSDFNQYDDSWAKLKELCERNLSELEYISLMGVYEEGLTMVEVGKRVGKDRVDISLARNRALRKLKKILTQQDENRDTKQADIPTPKQRVREIISSKANARYTATDSDYSKAMSFLYT